MPSSWLAPDATPGGKGVDDGGVLGNIALNEYLAAYRTSAAPNGYMLSHPGTLYTGQTVGGIIATAAHGSSLVEGGWPSKVIAVRVMLADGRVLDNVTANSHPLLFRALKTSVGRLGIVLHVKLAIMRQAHVVSAPRRSSMQGFLQKLHETEKAVRLSLELRSRGSAEGRAAADRALAAAPLHMTFGHLEIRKADRPRIRYEKWEVGPEGGLAYEPAMNASAREANAVAWHEWIDERRSKGPFRAFRDPHAVQEERMRWEEVRQLPAEPATFLWKRLESGAGGSRRLWYSDPKVCMRHTSSAGETPVLSHYLRAMHAGRIGQPPPAYHRWTSLGKGSQSCYNQTEFGVPWYNARRCLTAFLGVAEALIVKKRPMRAVALRWTGIDDSLLSPTSRFPRLYFNINTYHGERMPAAVVGVLRGPRCGATIHWGKHTWDYEHEVTYNSTVEQLGPSWCTFGCLAHALDPQSKFVGDGLAREVWTFSAFSSRSGRIVSGDAFGADCCVASGPDEAHFDTARCTCAANIAVGSERAVGACALMRSARLRDLICGEDQMDDWALMRGCRWTLLRKWLYVEGGVTPADELCASRPK
eukprot:scaffold30577_cov29-Tisochrysis_lutea.AAC.1